MRLVLRSIAAANSLKYSEEKRNTFQAFFVLVTWPVSLSGIYGTLLLPIILLKIRA